LDIQERTRPYFCVVVILLPVFLSGCAGTSVSLDKSLSHSEVVKIDKTKDEIYISAREWMAKNFKDSDEAITLSNQKEGKIVGRLRTRRFNCSMIEMQIFLNWDLTIKDGKYRIRQSPRYGIAYLGGAGGKRKFKKVGKKCLSKVKPNLKEFRGQLKEYIRESSSGF
ncbi:MAG: DUF4468 domain-containing protein, partial [Candidatus Aenigmatarchaeota archaeon]